MPRDDLCEDLPVTTAAVPSFPHARVTMLEDGSAHLNVAGRHADYPPAAPAVTRAAVIADAARIADGLGRAIRMTTVDPDGEWLIAVHPDGSASELSPTGDKFKRARAGTRPAEPAPPASLPDTISITDAQLRDLHPASPTKARTEPPTPVPAVPAAPALTLPLDEDLEETVLVSRKAAPSALLLFSTGQTAIVSRPVIAGRNPAATEGCAVLTILDDTRTVSKTHFMLEFRDAGIWITDQNSGNGVHVRRGDLAEETLAPGTPYLLEAGDQVRLGEMHFVLSLEAPATP